MVQPPFAPALDAQPRQVQVPARSALVLGRRVSAWVLLFAVTTVTCLVSLPRFHGLLLADDEADARRALALLGSRPLAEAAVVAGYSDQAHLSRQLREIAGISPREYLQRAAPGAHVPIPGR